MTYLPVLGVAGAARGGFGLFVATQEPDRERVTVSRPRESSVSMMS